MAAYFSTAQYMMKGLCVGSCLDKEKHKTDKEKAFLAVFVYATHATQAIAFE